MIAELELVLIALGLSVSLAYANNFWRDDDKKEIVMTEQDVKEFIRNNLEVRLKVERYPGFIADELIVDLAFAGEEEYFYSDSLPLSELESEQ